GADVARLGAGQAPAPGGIVQDVSQGLAQALERLPLQLFPRQRLRPRLPHRHDAGREASARNTRSGVMGSSVSRTPTASFTALATAAATGRTPASPSAAWAAKPYAAETLPRRSLDSISVGGS